MKRSLVIVARDQPEVFERLASLYAQDEWIEVLRDRRRGPRRTRMGNRPDRRSPPSPDTDLHKHGLIVIPRP